MASIDERVVAMSFENAKFEAGVAQTLATLGKLDTAIKNIGSTNGLQNIEAAANKVTLQQPMSALDKLRAKLGGAGANAAQGLGEIDRAGNKVTLEGPSAAVDKLQSKMGQLSAGTTFTDIERDADRTDLSGLSRALDNVSNKFSVLEGAAAVALGNIASQAAAKGANFAKSFTFAPLQQGLEEYQTNLNSIQTILANTQGQQVSGLGEVNKHLQELNKYSDQTIYNFSEMAKNIGTFTAAGVDLDKSTQSIKGIANLAALSGSNSQQASTAMYQLSQAIASGKVGLQDWNSVVNAGMGGAIFQKALIRTGQNMGTIADGAVHIDKATGKATINGETFRDSIMAKPGQKPWLTSDVLVKTLGQMTGDLTDAQLAAQGFDDQQIKAIQQTAKTAKEAATQVKTLPQVFDVAKETIGSGWAQTFQLIFGNFEQAKKTFTDLSQTINGFINRTANARNNLLKGFDALGGRDKLINAIKTAFHDLALAIAPIHDAFRTIFPPTTAKDLIGFVKNFQQLADTVGRFLVANQDRLRQTFQGFFAVLHIGQTVVKGILGVIAHLLGIVGHGAGGFLSITAAIGNFLTAIDNAVSKGGALTGVFAALENVLRAPLEALKAIGHLLTGLFTGADPKTAKGMSDALGNIGVKLGPLAPIVRAVSSAFEHFRNVLGDVSHFLEPIFTTVVDTVHTIGDKLTQAIKSINYDDAMSALQAGLTGGIFVVLKKAIGGGVDIKFFDGVKKNVVETLNALNGSLTAIQQNIKANSLLQIAVAVGVLAGGIFLLAKVDPKRLGTAMTAVAVGLGELVGSLRLLVGVGGVKSLIVIAPALVLLATALDILAIAVIAFSHLSWEELAKGLVGVGGALAAIGVGVRAIGPRIAIVGPALLPLAVAIDILAVAVKIFGDMKWEAIAKGLAGIGGALLVINLAVRGMGPSLLAIGPGLLILGAGLILISGALSSFGSMDIDTIAKGMAALAGSLGIIAVAVAAMPPTMIAQAAGLVVIGVALNEMAVALTILGKMKVGSIVKSLVAMGGALVILAVGLTAMSGTVLGAVALLGAATALAVLTPVLVTLGTLQWGTIFKGLAAIALALGTIGVVGLVAAPALLAIGAALALLGLGVITIGTGFLIFAKGIALLSDAGQKGIGVMVAAITAFIALIPNMAISFVKGLVSIVEEIAKVAPQVALALGVVIDSLLNTIISAAPKLAIAAGSLIDAFLAVIVKHAPQIISAGFRLLVQFLGAIDNNIQKVGHTVGNIIAKFLNQLATELPRIIAGGTKVLTSFLNGISAHIPQVVASAARVIVTWLTEVAAHIPELVRAGARVIVRFLDGIANNIGSVLKAGTHIITKLLDGIGDSVEEIVRAASRAIIRFVNAIGDRENVKRLVDAGFKAAIRFIQGVTDGIKNDDNLSKLVDAAMDLGFAIVEGLIKGLAGLPGKLADHLLGPIKGVVGKAKGLLKIFSPSKVFSDIGEQIVAGMGIGLSGFASSLDNGITGPIRQLIKQNGDAKKVGRFLGGEFRDGLDGAMKEQPTGRTGTILDTFDALHAKLKDEQTKLHDQIKKENDRLASELQKDHPSQVVIARLAKDIQGNTALLNTAKNSTTALMNSLKDEKARLIAVAGAYDEVGAKLDTAKQALADATKLRDDAIKSYTDAFDKLPDFGEKSSHQVADYKAALREQIIATQKYMATLQKLRDMGLDDQTYKKLLDAGTAGQDFATQLLSGGKGSIDELNGLDSQLASTAADLAKQTATNLYQAGIDAAQGLVDGLQAQHDAIKAVMDSLADMLVDALKRKLGIKSPSRVLAELGKFTAQGLADGLRGSTRLVAEAATGVADTAAAAMTDSLSHISDALASEVDTDLTITPVLDLTQVQKDASKLNDLANVVPITAAASFGQATAASQEVTDAQTAADAASAATVQQFEFNQYNTSPESLSDAEIYRQTNNQLSQAKRALGLAS